MSKEADGYKFGAKHYYASSIEGALKSLRNKFDLIVTTVSASDDLTP
jgi:uncharacterized zinc-type alcohol dehydrogenase-like protein